MNLDGLYHSAVSRGSVHHGLCFCVSPVSTPVVEIACKYLWVLSFIHFFFTPFPQRDLEFIWRRRDNFAICSSSLTTLVISLGSTSEALKEGCMWYVCTVEASVLCLIFRRAVEAALWSPGTVAFHSSSSGHRTTRSGTET